MECPIDHTTLQMSERSGIEIDYCPKCRGIWLDRGELYKIIELSAGRDVSASTSTERQSSRDDSHDSHEHDQPTYDHHDQRSNQKPKGKGSFIGDIFGGLGGD
jgi:Zn-finger nucleic acid-binding protein